ncbi:Inositol 1,4,5-triphosphate kinase 1 [Aphelenchoides besseyi]|nr:Inositol 1,4,5-triphosphate kinase 1 [Aphelenchoides besseyi]
MTTTTTKESIYKIALNSKLTWLVELSMGASQSARRSHANEKNREKVVKNGVNGTIAVTERSESRFRHCCCVKFPHRSSHACQSNGTVDAYEREFREPSVKPLSQQSNSCPIENSTQSNDDVEPPTMPSVGAALVSSGWRNDSVKRVLGATPSTDSNGAFYHSDDSLADEHRHFHGYNLSEQSHEVLQQIIRCFPFPSPRNSPRPTTKKSLARTVSNDPTALRSDHQIPEAPQTADAFLASSNGPSTWMLRKKRFNDLLHRVKSHEAPDELNSLGSSTSATTLCTDEKSSTKALGKLCKRFSSVNAITLERLKTRSVSPPLIRWARFIHGEKLSAGFLGVLKESQRASKRGPDVVVPQRNNVEGHRSGRTERSSEWRAWCCGCLNRRPPSSPSTQENTPTTPPMTDPQQRANVPFRRVLQSGLLQISLETMAVTALPLDCWLKERLKNWVQLSGHEGTIVPASNHTLWKKQPPNNTNEARAYTEIKADDALRGLTPKFYKEITHNGDSFIEIQDLLSQFPNTEQRAIMDIKIGFRTFLESEVSNTSKRNDLYKKMISIDPNEPTDEERAEEAITKLRYMQFRERESSTATLGFRIEAAQLPGGKLQKSFQKVRTAEQVLETLTLFFGARSAQIKRQLAARLREIRLGIEQSEFFATHEVVGSSILIVFDDVRTNAWMIDFAKSIEVPNGLRLNHRRSWELGNHEDGYLYGLDNLIEVSFSKLFPTKLVFRFWNDNRRFSLRPRKYKI